MNNIFTTHSMHGMSVYEIVQVNAACYYARELAHVPHVPPTPEELAEQAREEAAWAEYHASTAGRDEPYEPADWEVYGCFTQPEHAQRCIELHNELNCASEDVSAWGAPSECLADACRGPMRELEALEHHFSTRHPNEPKPNPYTERGLDDRTRPIRDSLPPGMTDDHDILVALGESSAL